MIVAGGLDSDGHGISIHPFDEGSQHQASIRYWPRPKLWVGANLKFDLAWAARVSETTPAKLVQGSQIWDVCHVEYILSRQRIRMPSLENCAERRGLALRKSSVVSELIKGGTCPSAIPIHLLKEYNETDLELTKQVFESQFAEAKERGMLPLIWSQMKALVATAEMEYNGIHIDTHVLDTYGAALDTQIRDAANMFCYQLGKVTGMAHLKGVIEKCYAYKIANDILSGKDAIEILASTKEVSFLLFGGKRKETEKKLVGKYKNGKDKYKNTEVEVEYKGLWFPSPHGSEINGNGYYTVDDKVLKSIINSGGSIPEFSAMVASILEYREASKQLSTYVDGVRKALWPGNVVHTNFNHSVTLTGRLSCSNPNLQNQTDGEIKRAYIPRDTNGLFIEFDYQQLEVIGLAVLSQDKQLLDDLRSGRDVHTELFRDMYGTEPTKEQRKAFKPLTFGLIYGAGANTLAENAGKTVSEAKLFIETFYRRYPAVRLMHAALVARAIEEREMTTRKTENGYPVGMFVLRTQTGREYEFYEYESEYKKGTVSFSPTELKNWQVQGFATGDVVPLVIGEVVEELTASKWYGTILPIVTVHDSIMFELRGNADVTEARNYLEKLLSNTRERIERRFGFDPGIDFHVEGKVGHNWKEMV